MIILIDNGHGISTAGKRSPDGRFREYLFARKVAAEIVTALKELKFDARLLVPEDADIPVAQRAARVNALCDVYGKDKVLLVSIHTNAAGSGLQWMSATGWEAWTSPGITKADTLAECLYNRAREILVPLRPDVPQSRLIRVDTSDGDSDKEGRLGILLQSRCPAVLTENLFHDNRADVEFLSSEHGRRAIAQLHVKGIVDYINTAG
ncbi:MAG: N-acetylmuramoyl-L-alanine amidase [Muribaculaceae bacterium]|nr:N-acetylmuramoyl-L-alanine amidase [Muribaculaceae bacterium]